VLANQEQLNVLLHNTKASGTNTDQTTAALMKIIIFQFLWNITHPRHNSEPEFHFSIWQNLDFVGDCSSSSSQLLGL